MYLSKKKPQSPTRRRRKSPLDLDDNNHDNASSGVSLHWKRRQRKGELPNAPHNEEKKSQSLQRRHLPCHVRQRMASLRFHLAKIPPHRMNALCILSFLFFGWSQWASSQAVADPQKRGAGLRFVPISADTYSIRFSSATKATFASAFPKQIFTVDRPEGLSWQDPHFGGLALQFQKTVDANLLERIISPNDAQQYSNQRSQLLQAIDDPHMSDRLPFDEELDYPVTCQRTSWGRTIHPVCNRFHELSALLGRAPPPAPRAVNDLQDDHFQVDYLSHGYFRDSWLYRYQPNSRLDLNTHDQHPLSSLSFVLKTLRLFQTFNYDTTNLIENEAVIMERLTASPRIVDIYGHCGTSLAAEYMQDITLELVPGKSILAADRGRMKQNDLDRIQMDDIHPMNNLTLAEKLDKALVMAESLADLHGFSGGAIVHGDVHPDQWLRSVSSSLSSPSSSSSSGQMKLNDFNNGMILEYSAQNHSYCDFWTWYDGTYKAPEELRGDFVGAPSDVWAMGNNIYILLTGLYPYYDTTSVSKIEEMIQGGETPFIDDRYRNRSMVEGRLVEIMEPCWALEPQDRVDIFEIVAHLRETQRLYQQETTPT